MPLPVSAILLAAGWSRRMGRPKQLLPVNGTPAVRRSAESILAAGVGELVVVVGPERAAIEAALAGLPVLVVPVDDTAGEMADSARAGLHSLKSGAGAVLICLADHPLASPDTIIALMKEHEAAPDAIIVPCRKGRRGHPTLFPRTALQELFQGLHLREIIQRVPSRVRLLDVPDDGVILDMDTESDYQAILKQAADSPART